MKSILVYRFSAIGDVLLCYPVLRAVLELNPELKITFVTQKFLSPFFSDIPRLEVLGVDLKRDYPGLKGIYKLSQTLKAKNDFDFVCDLHQVIRTRLLNVLMGKKTYKIDKGRKEKKEFIKNLKAAPLPHSTQRYLDVFKSAGLKVPEAAELSSYVFERKSLAPELSSQIKPEGFNLGFAPYAKHFTKTWPKHYLEQFIALNEAQQKFNIYLFGGPGEEARHFDELSQKYSKVTNLAGKFKFLDEVTLMQSMDQMIVMDSANMHLASLAGAPMISVWGGTHPDIGFAPISLTSEILQVDRSALGCRPCSVFGRGDCPKKHFSCMLKLEPELLMERVVTRAKELS